MSSGPAYAASGPFGHQPTASTSTSSSTSTSQAALNKAASKRKVSHISKACLQCRRRKIRCSGEQPACASCVHVGHDCHYSNAEDGRKAGAVQRSKLAQQRRVKEANGDEVHDLRKRNTVLRTRLIALERALSKRGVSITEALEESADLLAIDAGADSDGRDRETSEVSAADTDWIPSSGAEDVVTDFDRLHLDDLSSSTLCHYGPTSALNHLATAGPSLQSPLSMNRQSHSPTAREASILPSSFGSQSAAFPWLQPKQDVEWDRNLPNLGISRDTHDTLVELCEAFFTTWVCILDVAAFKRDMQICLGQSWGDTTPPTRTPFYSPLLHNMVLAIGACLWHGDRMMKSFPPINQSIAPEGARDRDLAEMAADTFLARAKECFDVECERPMQSLVNGLLLMASINSGKARPNLGYVLFNSAVASSHALGINIDCADFVKKGVITAETRSHRDNLFYTVYVQDKLWSMAVGRFTNISQDDHNIPIPEINPAHDKTPWIAPRGWRDVEANGLTLAHGRPGYASTCFQATVKLALIQNSILRKFYSLKPDVRSPAQIQTIETLQAELVQWQKDLPECIRLDSAAVPPPHVLTMHITYQYAIMLLNRPMYQRLLHRDPTHTSVQDCEAAASKVVELLGLYDHFYSINYAPLSSIQTTFVAGTIHLLKGLGAAKRDDARHLNSALQGGAICIVSLEKFSFTWRTSLRISRILQSLFNVWLPNSVQHMRQNGWLAPDKLDTPTTGTSSNGFQINEQQVAVPMAIQAMPAAQLPPYGGFVQPPVNAFNTYNPTSNALDFSTWFNSPSTDQPPQSLDGALASAPTPTSRPQYPFASASVTSPTQTATPSSSEFLRQLLSHQQYQSQAGDIPDITSTTGLASDQTYLGTNWNDSTTAQDILSNFDFSIEAFNAMLKSSTAEADQFATM